MNGKYNASLGLREPFPNDIPTCDKWKGRSFRYPRNLAWTAQNVLINWCSMMSACDTEPEDIWSG